MPATRPGRALIVGERHQRFRRGHLRPRGVDPRGVGLDLQVERADGEDDGLADIAEVRLPGAHERLPGAVAADGARVEERRRHREARVEDPERSDDRRDAGNLEAEGRRAEHLIGLPHRSRDVRQQLAERRQPGALRAPEALFLEDGGEVLRQPATDGFGERQRQRRRRHLADRHATQLDRERLTLRGRRGRCAGGQQE